MTEHTPMFKNNHNTCHPRFGFTPKRSIAFPKAFFFYCESILVFFYILDSMKLLFFTKKEFKAEEKIVFWFYSLIIFFEEKIDQTIRYARISKQLTCTYT